MGLSDGRKSFPIGLAVLIQYRSVTATQLPASHAAVAITLNAKTSSLKSSECEWVRFFSHSHSVRKFLKILNIYTVTRFWLVCTKNWLHNWRNRRIPLFSWLIAMQLHMLVNCYLLYHSHNMDWLKTHDDHLWHHTDITNLLFCMTTTICFSQLGSNDELVAMQKPVTIFGSALCWRRRT